MKILLIVPRFNITTKKDYFYWFPIGLAYISATLKKAGYDVNCLNINHFNGTVNEIVNNALDKTKYDIVCTGGLALYYISIEKIIEAVKNHPSNPKIILGGTIVTSESELMLDSLKPDFIVIGEGEITIVELLKCIKNKSDFKIVKGIGFLDKEGKKIFTKPQEQIRDLDSLPMPDFEGLGFKEYIDEESFDVFLQHFDNPRTYTILGSRGCPFQCTFCYHCLGAGYRIRSIGNIMEEISYAVKNYKINSLYITDDLFAANKLRLADFCTKLKELTKDIPDFKWCCSLWVSVLDKEILTLLKESGCLYVSLGFESYSPVVLKSMKKYITPEQINKSLELGEETGMIINANFIFGDVAETAETAKETIDFWKKKCNGQIPIFFIQPYPGSEIFNKCVEKGIIKDKLDYIKNKMPYLNSINMTNSMSDKEFSQLVKDITEARRKYCEYVIPLKMERNGINKYNIDVKCPYCEEIINYKRVPIPKKYRFSYGVACRKCNKRFFICSRPYKIFNDNYDKLEYLRNKIFSFKDNFVKSRI